MFRHARLTYVLIAALLLSMCSTLFIAPPKEVQAASLGTIDENDTIYQIMVDRFHDGDPSNNATGAAIRYGETSEEDFRYMKGGDWQGVIDKLGYIKNMGYTAIWISPVAEPQMTNRDNNGTGRNTAYHGYNVKDPNKANPYFGTKEKLKELVDSAHALGIKVIIDVVPNHIGDYMLGTQAYYDIPGLQPAAPFNNPSWYHHNGDIDWALVEGQYAQWAQDHLENHDLGGLDDVDFDVPAAKQAIFDSIKGWFDYTGADGARVDAAKLMKPTDIGALQNYIGVNTFGENFDGNPEFVSRWVGTGKEWGMLDFPLFFQVLSSFAYGNSFETTVKSAFAQDSLYGGNENHMVTFIDNHDRNRFLTEAGGNVQKLQNALTFIFAARGMPVVFQGTEQNKGNGNGQIITGGIADTWNRWSMVKRDANGNVIENYFNENTNTYQHVAKLNQIRKNNPALRTGKQREMWAAQNLYAFSRRIDSGANQGQEVISVFSNAQSGTQTVTIPLRAESTLAVGTVLTNQLASGDTVTVQAGGVTGKQITVSVGANSAKIYAANTTPPPPGNKVTIYYKQGFTTPYIHYRPVGGTWTTAPGVPIPASEVPGYNKITIDIGTATQLEACFNNGSGSWDSNNSQNYLFGVGTWTYTPIGSITPGGPIQDTEAPSAPTNVSAAAQGASTVQLSWTASTDNIGVTGYEVYRNGALAGTTATTSYTDNGLAANTSYSYTVKAYDGAGNKSPLSSPPATVTTGSGNTATIYYKNTAYTNAYIHYKLDGSTTWTTAPGVQMQSSAFSGYKSITIQLGSATGLTAAFNNGSGSWDNNGGNNYHFGVGTWSLVNGNITAGEPQADSVTFRVTVPSSTPTNSPVYLASSLNNWNAADPAYQLTKGTDGVYSITLSLPAGTAIQYKFTRGSWATVEVNSSGGDITNRSLTTSGGAQTVPITVQRWKS